VIRYSILVLAVAATSLALLVLSVAREPALRDAVAFGAAVATLNTLLAHALVGFAERRPNKVFMGAVLGGMLGRMLLMLAAVVVGVLALGLARVPLVASLLGYFTLFLVLELTVQHRHFSGAVASR